MVFFYSNNPPRTTPMTTPISLKSTRLEILLEVTEDRGIESGRWDLEQQITLPSVERVGVDLRKKRTGEWGSRSLSFFPMLSVCLREVFGRRARRGGEWRLHRECQESGERSTNPSTPTFHIQKARMHGGIKYRSPPSMPGIPILLLDKMWNASKPHSQKLVLQTL